LVTPRSPAEGNRRRHAKPVDAKLASRKAARAAASPPPDSGRSHRRSGSHRADRCRSGEGAPRRECTHRPDADTALGRSDVPDDPDNADDDHDDHDDHASTCDDHLTPRSFDFGTRDRVAHVSPGNHSHHVSPNNHHHTARGHLRRHLTLMTPFMAQRVAIEARGHLHRRPQEGVRVDLEARRQGQPS
jgi:hypothetical protein